MQLLEEWEDVPSVGPALAAMFVHSGLYVDDVVQMRRWNEGEESFEDFYYHSDDLSSVRALTDEDGELVELYDYHEYGLPTITDPNTIVNGRPALLASSAVGNPFLFTGRMYDAETRLYHYRTRQYEPRMGRFISVDSIGVWGDEENLGNGYAYVGNMPADYVDPWGLKTSPTLTPQPVRPISRLPREWRPPLRHPNYFHPRSFDDWHRENKRPRPNNAPLFDIRTPPRAVPPQFELPPAAQPDSRPGPWRPGYAPWERRNPRQTCTNNQLDAIQKWMHEICDKQGPSSCTGAMSCSDLERAMLIHDACVMARLRVGELCYGGVLDEDHKKEIENREKGYERCRHMWEAKGCHKVPANRSPCFTAPRK